MSEKIPDNHSLTRGARSVGSGRRQLRGGRAVPETRVGVGKPETAGTRSCLGGKEGSLCCCFNQSGSFCDSLGTDSLNLF